MDSNIVARDNLILEKERELISIQQQATTFESEITTLKVRLEKSKTEIFEKDKLVAEWKVTIELLKEQMRADKETTNSEWKAENEVMFLKKDKTLLLLIKYSFFIAEVERKDSWS